MRRVEEVAKKMNISMAQVAIAWTLQKDGVTAPIVGTTSLDNLKDILGRPAENEISVIHKAEIDDLFCLRGQLGSTSSYPRRTCNTWRSCTNRRRS